MVDTVMAIGTNPPVLPTSNNVGRNNVILNELAIPLYTPPSREDVNEGGQFLFEHFVHEDFEHAGMDATSLISTNRGTGDSSAFVTPPHLNDSLDSSRYRTPLTHSGISQSESTPNVSNRYKNDNLSVLGKNLRDLADQFASSKEGKQVRKHAEKVNLSEITESSFWELLVELFHDGLSTERVVALFYFCSMLLVRAAKENFTMLIKELFTWSLNFIRSRVCQWVFENGGWERVFSSIYEFLVKVGIVTLIFVGVVCGAVYIRNNISK